MIENAIEDVREDSYENKYYNKNLHKIRMDQITSVNMICRRQFCCFKDKTELQKIIDKAESTFSDDINLLKIIKRIRLLTTVLQQKGILTKKSK